jgi:hypothetical protein
VYLLSHFNIDHTGVRIFQSKILKSEKWNFYTIRIFTLVSVIMREEGYRAQDHDNSIILWQKWVRKSSGLDAILSPGFIEAAEK